MEEMCIVCGATEGHGLVETDDGIFECKVCDEAEVTVGTELERLEYLDEVARENATEWENDR